jgi:hypothetical protein
VAGKRIFVSLMLISALALSGCTSSTAWNPGPVLPLLDVSGRYSSSNISGVGVVELILRYDEDGGFFRAEMSERINGGEGESVGVGTIGDSHLIINFDRRLPTDFYFAGNVTVDSDSVDTLDGNFILPSGNGSLPVVFTYLGAAPPPAEEEE